MLAIDIKVVPGIAKIVLHVEVVLYREGVLNKIKISVLPLRLKRQVPEIHFAQLTDVHILIAGM